MKKLHFIVLLCLVCGLLSCTQTETSTTTEALNQNEIAEAIHKVSRSGLYGNSEKLMKYMEMIDDRNVGRVVNTYMNTYGESIFGAVMRNRFISSDTRANALKHIKDMCMQQTKRFGIYTDDIDKSMEGHIDYEKKKSGRMKSTNMDRDFRFLTDRYNQTLQENTLYSANGKIDEEFKQGEYLGDCWLISCIKSLSANPKGQEMLDDIISIDKNGNVTVQLKGVDKKYTISKEELEGTNELAKGDLDVRAVEIAIRRYFQETGDHANLLEKIKNRFSGARIDFREYNMYRGIYNLSRPYYILFGKPVIPDSKTNKCTIDQVKTNRYSTVVSSYKNNYNVEGFYKSHTYAVIGADDNYVYLSEPYTDTTLRMLHNDFLKLFNINYSNKLSD